MSPRPFLFTRLLAAVLLVTSVAFLPGCDTKEKIVDIETPAGEVEVNKDTSSGRVEVDVSDDES